MHESHQQQPRSHSQAHQIRLPQRRCSYVNRRIECHADVSVKAGKSDPNDRLAEPAVQRIGNSHEAALAPSSPPLVLYDPIVRSVVTDELHRVVDQRSSIGGTSRVDAARIGSETSVRGDTYHERPRIGQELLDLGCCERIVEVGGAVSQIDPVGIGADAGSAGREARAHAVRSVGVVAAKHPAHLGQVDHRVSDVARRAVAGPPVEGVEVGALQHCLLREAQVESLHQQPGFVGGHGGEGPTAPASTLVLHRGDEAESIVVQSGRRHCRNHRRRNCQLGAAPQLLLEGGKVDEIQVPLFLISTGVLWHSASVRSEHLVSISLQVEFGSLLTVFTQSQLSMKISSRQWYSAECAEQFLEKSEMNCSKSQSTAWQ